MIKYFTPLLFLASWTYVFAQPNDSSFRYETNGYGITFPMQPEELNQAKASSLGQLQLTIAAYEPGDPLKDKNHLYMAMESKYPDSTIHSDKVETLDSFFRSSIDAAVKAVYGTLLSETQGRIGKYPFRLFEIDYSNGLAIIKMKAILVRNRFIIIQTITDSKSYPNAAADKFFNSFTLK